MKISLTKAGKRYNRDWIFRNFSYEFVSGNSYAITGPNGSGKSTLLQAIAGALMLSEGEISYESGAGSRVSSAISVTQARENSPTTNHKLQTYPTGSHATISPVQPDNIYQHLSIAAPYLELIEEMTINEFLKFHRQFKPFLPAVTIDEIISVVGLQKASHKQIRYYSSGMKQRVKLAQAIFSDVPIILLDEPSTNLDSEGIQLYQQLINDYCMQRLVIVSSNDKVEYEFCKERLNIMDYK